MSGEAFPESSSTQINIAKKVRAVVHNHYSSTFQNEYLSDFDNAPPLSEGKFFSRFWFISNIVGRKAVIDFQRLHDLTNLQVSLLYWTGNISVENGEVNVNARKWTQFLGKAIIAFILIIGLASIFIMSCESLLSHQINLSIYASAGASLTWMVLTNLFYLYPYNLANKISHYKNQSN